MPGLISILFWWKPHPERLLTLNEVRSHFIFARLSTYIIDMCISLSLPPLIPSCVTWKHQPIHHAPYIKSYIKDNTKASTENKSIHSLHLPYMDRYFSTVGSPNGTRSPARGWYYSTQHMVNEQFTHKRLNCENNSIVFPTGCLLKRIWLSSNVSSAWAVTLGEKTSIM